MSKAYLDFLGLLPPKPLQGGDSDCHHLGDGIKTRQKEQIHDSANQLVDALLESIARQHLHIGMLETTNSGALDFKDLAVWSIKTALEAAFEAGRASAGSADNGR